MENTGDQGSEMKMDDLRMIATAWGVNTSPGRSKQNIIRDIQAREGYTPCFGTKKTCDEGCMWKSDCIGEDLDQLESGIPDEA
jgi:hypothetical protein